MFVASVPAWGATGGSPKSWGAAGRRRRQSVLDGDDLHQDHAGTILFLHGVTEPLVTTLR